MKATFLATVFGAVKAAHFPKEQYESGRVHQRILDMKNVCDLQILVILSWSI